jgi:hypothetical protein
MMVPTGSARVATSTSGPAEPPARQPPAERLLPRNMFFAITAVTPCNEERADQ